MKKILAIVIAVLMIGALAVTFTACGEDTPEFLEKTLTATEAEDYVFGANGAINNGGKVFNVKATFSGNEKGITSRGETILVLDTTEGANFASIYDNQTSKDDGEITNNTEFLFINWTERNGTMRNSGVVHAYSRNGETPVSSLLTSGYEGIQNNLLKNSELQRGKSILENDIHNPNKDVYDTLQYTAKAIYNNDSAMTDLGKVEVTITYHYEDDGQTVNGTANIVMSMREVTIYDGTTENLLVFDSIVVTESAGRNMTINYVYGVDSLGAPDLDDLSGTWPEAYPIA